MLPLMMLIYVTILSSNAIFKTGPRATNMVLEGTMAPCW